MADLLITHGKVGTMDAERRFFDDGAVAIEGNTIVAVGPTSEVVAAHPAPRAIDASGRIVLPGFVCTHGHMAATLSHNMPVDFSRFTKFTDMMEMWWWPQVEDQTLADDIYWATKFAAARMLKSGTTTIGDMLEAPSALPGALDHQARACEEAGIRAVLAFEATERTSKALGDLAMQENLRFVRERNRPGARITGRFACHTAYTAPPDMLREARRLANETGAGLFIHVAEFPPFLTVERWGKPDPQALELTPDGRLRVRIGGVDLGQGSNTTIAQIAAQATGVPFGRVAVAPVDVFHSPDGGVTSASRTTYVSGNAVVHAAAKLRAAMAEYAARQLGAEAARVALKDGRFVADGASVSLADLAAQAAADGVRFAAQHHYDSPPTYALWHHGPPDPNAPKGSDWFFAYSYATQVAVVDVDEVLGRVVVAKIVAAHDVGRAVNPQGIEAQIEGSALMGMGYALSEAFILDRGRLVTDNLRKCHIPTFKDAPEIVTIIVEDEEPSGPFGAKGIAEAAAIPTAPAILNAIFDAVGARIRHLPATPDTVMNAMHALSDEGAKRDA